MDEADKKRFCVLAQILKICGEQELTPDEVADIADSLTHLVELVKNGGSMTDEEILEYVKNYKHKS